MARGEPFEERAKQREAPNNWAAWFRERMDRGGCDDPTELLPDALGRLEQIIDDRIAAEIKQLKAVLKGALK